LVERPEIKFTEFSKKNTDKFGWWHLSCSYKVTNRGKVEIKANLFNQGSVDVKKSTDLIEIDRYI